MSGVNPDDNKANSCKSNWSPMFFKYLGAGIFPFFIDATPNIIFEYLAII
jgi:hypothetical protein